MKVQATGRGFIYGVRRQKGDTFELHHVDHFSKRWMKQLDGGQPAASEAKEPDEATKKKLMAGQAGPAAEQAKKQTPQEREHKVKWNLGRNRYQVLAPDGSVVGEHPEKADAQQDAQQRNATYSKE